MQVSVRRWEEVQKRYLVPKQLIDWPCHQVRLLMTARRRRSLLALLQDIWRNLLTSQSSYNYVKEVIRKSRVFIECIKNVYLKSARGIQYVNKSSKMAKCIVSPLLHPWLISETRMTLMMEIIWSLLGRPPSLAQRRNGRSCLRWSWQSTMSSHWSRWRSRRSMKTWFSKKCN